MSRERLRLEGEAILREETGAEAVDRLCAQCGSSAHGRPLVSGGLHVSLSYAADLVAVAWSTSGPVGIDVELGEHHLEWTRLEALLKAGGEGIAEHADEPVDLSAFPTRELPLLGGYVGTVAGDDVSWRLGGPAARRSEARP